MDKALQELNLEDDFLFAKVMADEEICKRVLEKILGIEIEKIELLIEQKTIEILRKSWELKPSYVIFICTFDPFDRGFSYYTFKNTCVEDSTLFLGDDTTKVFLNSKGKSDTIDDALREFLGYLGNSTDTYVETVESDLVKMLHDKVIEVKESKEMEVDYMTLLERDREMREEGREQGAIINTIKIVRKKLEKGQNLEVIADALELEKAEVETIIKFIVNNKDLANAELAKIIQGDKEVSE